jgi:serine/threonine protein kinase
MSTPSGPTADQSDEAGQVGQQLGKYRLLHQLGKGGMGTVYAAVHTDIGQQAAIKVLNSSLAEDEVALARFFDEARLLSIVEHPSLVKIYDLERGRPGPTYIAMELLKGETLHHRLAALNPPGRDGGPQGLRTADALRIVRQVASGMAAVHEKGIIHRVPFPSSVAAQA